MENSILQQGIQITRHVLHSLYCSRDLEEALLYLADDVIFVASGEKERKITKNKVGIHFRKWCDPIPVCEITNETLDAVDYGTYCLVYGGFRIRSKERSKKPLEIYQQFSFFLEKQGDSMLVKHMHITATDMINFDYHNQLLMELDVEKSRCKVALENITDVMFEYKIEQDSLTTFQRIEKGGKVTLEQYVTPKFSKSLWTRVVIHPDDDAEFLSLLNGEQQKEIEIHTRSMQSPGKWQLNRVNCSIVYDGDQRPVRTIGILKEIAGDRKNRTESIHLSQQDLLTKLLNQMAAKQQIQQYLNTKHIYNQSALMVIDLDNFKKVNESMGHLFGNDVLVATSVVLKDNIRAEDIVGRIGGDVFLLLLKSADYKAAALCGKRIIDKVAQIGFRDREIVSCSIGIAMTTNANEEYEDLLRMADRALYFAKAKGKSQYIFYEDDLGQAVQAVNENGH